MPKSYHVNLTEVERESLRKLLANRKSQSVFVKRACILLAFRTAKYVRDAQRFIEDSFEIAVRGKKRTVFKEKKFDGRVQAQVIALRGISRRVVNQEELKKQIAAYQIRLKKKEIKIDWQFAAKDARVKLKRFYPPINLD